jgi:hypothetical protein
MAKVKNLFLTLAIGLRALDFSSGSFRLKVCGLEICQSFRPRETYRMETPHLSSSFGKRKDMSAVIAKAEMPARLQAAYFQTGPLAERAQVFAAVQRVNVCGRVAFDRHGQDQLAAGRKHARNLADHDFGLRHVLYNLGGDD